MTPGSGVLMLGCGHISHIVKMHHFFRNLLLCSQALIGQTKYIVMMTKEGSSKIVIFMTPWAGVFAQRRDHTSQIVESIFPIKIIFSTPKHISDKLSI